MTLGKHNPPVKQKKSYCLTYTNGTPDVFKSLRVARQHASIARRIGEFKSLMNQNGVLLPLMIVLFLSFTSCDSNYIHVMDTTTGKIELIAERHGLTEVGDTLITSTSSYSMNTTFYGKFVDEVPEMYTYSYVSRRGDSITSAVYYNKVVRLK